jgi:hypothetical protein
MAATKIHDPFNWMGFNFIYVDLVVVIEQAVVCQGLGT